MLDEDDSMLDEDDCLDSNQRNWCGKLDTKDRDVIFKLITLGVIIFMVYLRKDTRHKTLRQSYQGMDHSK